MESKIAVIGDKDLTEGFAAAGFQVFSPEDKETAIASALDEVVRDNFSICFILEKLALKIKEKIRELGARSYPAIVILPDYRENLSLTDEFLKDIIVRAIGAESIESIKGVAT